MKVVIVEDEQLTAEDLAETLLKLTGDIEVVKTLTSVAEAVAYFTHHQAADLVFCDIQLGDGQSFDIFKKVQLNMPVIFCTAYDEFALQAFKNNGIDYILKPFTKKTVKGAIDKYRLLRNTISPAETEYTGPQYHPLRNELPGKKVSSLLVNWKDKIIPVKLADIALFNIEYKMVQLVTFDNHRYFISHTLDELEGICSQDFYRANRQYLINKEVVKEAHQYHARKLFIKLKVEGNHEVLISKNKVPEFLSWLRS